MLNKEITWASCSIPPYFCRQNKKKSFIPLKCKIRLSHIILWRFGHTSYSHVILEKNNLFIYNSSYMHQEIKEVNPAAAYERIQKGALLLDIRESEEIEMLAFDVEEQIFIPQSEFAYRFREIPPDREIIVGCHSGNRSQSAILFLLKEKYDNVYNLNGGIEKWLDQDLPVKWDNYKAESTIHVHKN